MRLRTHIAALLAITALATPLAATAATPGLAWDSVTRVSVNTDPASLQPGSFDDDYAAASAVQEQPASGGGLFGKFKAAVSLGQSMQDMMTKGSAERHYVAGSKERVDRVALGTATITDCAARTITTLDLRRKTYRIESMDHPSSPATGGESGSAGAPEKDDGTRVAIRVTNSLLGPREVGGASTVGYRSSVNFTETKASGESQSQDADLLGYYAARSMPLPACAHFGIPQMGGQGAGAMMAGAGRLMQSLRAAGLDRRFSLKQSGPALPVGRFSMFEAMTFSGQRGNSFTFITERGHVRAVGANDAVFGIPSGFTQEQ